MDKDKFTDADKITGVAVAILVILMVGSYVFGKSSNSIAISKIPEIATTTIIEKSLTTSDDEKCKNDYGSNSISSGQKNDTGGPNCECKNGFEFNQELTKCIPLKSNNQICVNDFGFGSIYSGKKNDNGGPICDCKAGYEWTANGKSCQLLREKTPPLQDGVLCNGTSWSKCPSGQNFVCPSTGDAYCQLSPTYSAPSSQQQTNFSAEKAQVLASLKAQLQSYQNQYTELSNEISQLRSQADQLCSSVPMEFQQGTAQVEARYNASICLAKQQFISGKTQLLQSIQNTEANIQQKINTINNFPI